ncbi:MAG: hypothetical protein J6K42_03350 [Clostridia bacterium]|nr:hypothetical protein [Clostridia bacterium]
MARARKVNPRIFPNNLIIGKAKALPEKKHKSAYHLCLEEAFADLIIDEDETYLKRIVEDLMENEVTINNFRSLELSIYVNGTKLTTKLLVNNNRIAIKIMIPTYATKLILTSNESVPTMKYIGNIGVNKKLEVIQQKINSIYA